MAESVSSEFEMLSEMASCTASLSIVDDPTDQLDHQDPLQRIEEWPVSSPSADSEREIQILTEYNEILCKKLRKETEEKNKLKTQLDECNELLKKEQEANNALRTELANVKRYANAHEAKLAEFAKTQSCATIDELGVDNKKGRVLVENEIELCRSTEKRRMLGIISFMAQLYLHRLIIRRIIYWCVIEFLKRYDNEKDEVFIEYAVVLLKTAGKEYEWDEEQERVSAYRLNGNINLDKAFDHLSKMKPTLSNRIRFAIMDLEDLRKNNWVPRSTITRQMKK